MHLLRKIMWWVLSPRSPHNRVRTIRQADRMAGSSVTFAQKQRESKSSTKVTSSKKTATRTSVFDGLGLLPPWLRELWLRNRPFELAPAGEPASDPTMTCARSLAKLLRLPQPGNADGSQVGVRLADFALHWRSLLGNYRATGIVEDGVGIAFQQRPQLTHQCITFRTRNSRQNFQQAVDALLMKGAIERATNVTSLGYYSRLFLVFQKDRRSATCNRPVHFQPPHGSSTLQDGDAWVHPFSHQKSGVDGIGRQMRCLTSCSDASGRPQVSAFRGQQEGLPVHLSTIWAGNFSTRVHQAAASRRLAVKAARCEATCLLGRLVDQSRYPRTDPTARPDNHQGAPVSWLDHQLREVRSHTKSRLSVHRDAVRHSTFHSGAPTEDASKGPISSSALDDRSEHHSPRFAQTSRHVGVHGFADKDGCVFVGSNGGPPHHGARGPRAGPTGSKFLSGFCQRWPGGHLQQSCKVYPSSPWSRK